MKRFGTNWTKRNSVGWRGTFDRKRPLPNAKIIPMHSTRFDNNFCFRFSARSIATKTVLVDNHHGSYDDSQRRKIPDDGLSLGDFVHREKYAQPPTHPADSNAQRTPKGTFHIKTYGCQMNVSDSDIVRAVLLEHGYVEATKENSPAPKTTIGGSKKKDLVWTPESSADIILTNTCAIREKAEEKVWQRLFHLRKRKGSQQIVGVLGCMAERLQTKLLEEKVADLVVGPDAYRDLPRLLEQLSADAVGENKPNKEAEGLTESSSLEANHRQTEKPLGKSKRSTAINVDLSTIETYDDILPVRDERADNPHSAFVSIQRGCSNRCSFCIVPFTRGGKERSRPFQSIVDEVTYMVETQNLKEVVLLGQNVNSYHDRSPQALEAKPDLNILSLSNEGFRSRIKRPNIGGYRFVDLVEAVAEISPELRIRYTSPHPKDYPLELLQLMAERPNICSQLHMPAQSGSTDMLRRMKRGYTREAYLELIDTVKDVIPDVAISSDFIAGFCDETEDEHEDTLSLLKYVEYDQAFLFAYSMRDKTYASRAMNDNVPSDIKQRRLQELIDVFRETVHTKNEREEVGKLRLVLVEGPTKKQRADALGNMATWHGRTDQNKRILFEVEKSPTEEAGMRSALIRKEAYALKEFSNESDQIDSRSARNSIGLDDLSSSFGNETVDILTPGDYAVVSVTEAKGHTLRGRLLRKTTLSDFSGLDSVDTPSML